MARVTSKRLLQVYETLRGHNGLRGWWPGNSRLEVIVGAILTQNTNWKNVEAALRNLKANEWLNVPALRTVPESDLAEAIRPSGYFRQKAKKLKAFVSFLDESYGGSLRRMAKAGGATLREQLLGIWGIGPETADSILLYVFDKPVFVVDTYTGRVMKRHGWADPKAGYEELRAIFESRLEPDTEMWSDFHAQIVWVGANHCGTKPRCDECPLRSFLPNGHPIAFP